MPEKDQFVPLAPWRKQFLDTSKMTAYRAETARVLREALARSDDARALRREIFTTDADLIPDEAPGTLTVRLHHLTNPPIECPARVTRFSSTAGFASTASITAVTCASASGIILVTPAMFYFLHAGLCRYGHVEDSLGMFRERFDHMLRADTNGTLWEEWWLDRTGRGGVVTKMDTRSDVQTGSAFPPMLFAKYVLGIRPTQPGLSEVTLFRSPSGLHHIEGAFPSTEGVLLVRWYLNEDGGGELKVPGTMGGETRSRKFGWDRPRADCGGWPAAEQRIAGAEAYRIEPGLSCGSVRA